jgi:hypothetical protein
MAAFRARRSALSYTNNGGRFVVYLRCGGGQVDHICPLACYDADVPENMQWLTAEQNRAKNDDCAACGLKRRRVRCGRIDGFAARVPAWWRSNSALRSREVHAAPVVRPEPLEKVYT